MSTKITYRADLEGLGRFVRERRWALGLTQEQLGRRLDWVQERISMLENAKYGMPSMGAMACLADALEVEHVELLRAAGFLRGMAPSAASAQTGASFEKNRVRPTLSREYVVLVDQLVRMQDQLTLVGERIEAVDRLGRLMRARRGQLDLLMSTLQANTPAEPPS
ncbi:MAG: helix-turn-helix domain-containing protein [Chloroflexi bacterium]|nr:helix-turn-helix domain-containing protein [Chloroflexota bacterium]